MRTDQIDLIGLYESMCRLRAVELAQNSLWEQGLISGEMHSGVGEEGIVAGVAEHLHDGDAVACDHRATATFAARGAELAAVLLELLGHPEGSNGGWGGHMHLMDRDRLLLADGIVGSAGPGACGFALSARHLRPGSIAVAFFGEGALNQGALMESFNLARVWRLPVLFVCKDNGWSITTRTSEVSSTRAIRRARGFRLHSASVSGSDPVAVHRTAGRLVRRVRARGEPAFLHARCFRPDGHFLGDPMLRVLGDPLGQARDVALPLVRAAQRADHAARAPTRIAAMVDVTRRVATAAAATTWRRRSDPLARLARRIDIDVARSIEERTADDVRGAKDHALAVAAEGR